MDAGRLEDQTHRFGVYVGDHEHTDKKCWRMEEGTDYKKEINKRRLVEVPVLSRNMVKIVSKMTQNKYSLLV